MEKNQQDKTQKIIRLGICAMEKKSIFKAYATHIKWFKTIFRNINNNI